MVSYGSLVSNSRWTTFGLGRGFHYLPPSSGCKLWITHLEVSPCHLKIEGCEPIGFVHHGKLALGLALVLGPQTLLTTGNLAGLVSFRLRVVYVPRRASTEHAITHFHLLSSRV